MLPRPLAWLAIAAAFVGCGPTEGAADTQPAPAGRPSPSLARYDEASRRSACEAPIGTDRADRATQTFYAPEDEHDLYDPLSSMFVASDGNVYFAANDNYWRVQAFVLDPGTGRATQLTHFDVRTGLAQTWTFAEALGRVFFGVPLGRDIENDDAAVEARLYVTDGTPGGTHDAGRKARVDDYFADDSTLVGTKSALYVAHGGGYERVTAEGTAGPVVSGSPVRVGERVVFLRSDGASIVDTDGASAELGPGGPKATSRVRELLRTELGTLFSDDPNAPISDGVRFIRASDLHVERIAEKGAAVAVAVGGKMFVRLANEVLVTDGTQAGTVVLARHSSASQKPALAAMDGRAYFEASNGIWASDGTAAGTALFRPNRAVRPDGDIVAHRGRLYFGYYEPGGQGRRLLSTDDGCAFRDVHLGTDGGYWPDQLTETPRGLVFSVRGHLGRAVAVTW